jgi:hypothetical protein
VWAEAGKKTKKQNSSSLRKKTSCPAADGIRVGVVSFAAKESFVIKVLVCGYMQWRNGGKE